MLEPSGPNFAPHPMPITLAFYLSAFLESFERDADRLQSLWQRVNRCALGTGVLACSSWPLNRNRLAELLGFDGPIENGLDSWQVSLFDVPSLFALEP